MIDHAPLRLIGGEHLDEGSSGPLRLYADLLAQAQPGTRTTARQVDLAARYQRDVKTIRRWTRQLERALCLTTERQAHDGMLFRLLVTIDEARRALNVRTCPDIPDMSGQPSADAAHTSLHARDTATATTAAAPPDIPDIPDTSGRSGLTTEGLMAMWGLSNAPDYFAEAFAELTADELAYVERERTKLRQPGNWRAVEQLMASARAQTLGAALRARYAAQAPRDAAPEPVPGREAEAAREMAAHVSAAEAATRPRRRRSKREQLADRTLTALDRIARWLDRRPS